MKQITMSDMQQQSAAADAIASAPRAPCSIQELSDSVNDLIIAMGAVPCAHRHPLHLRATVAIKGSFRGAEF